MVLARLTIHYIKTKGVVNMWAHCSYYKRSCWHNSFLCLLGSKNLKTNRCPYKKTIKHWPWFHTQWSVVKDVHSFAYHRKKHLSCSTAQTVYCSDSAGWMCVSGSFYSQVLCWDTPACCLGICSWPIPRWFIFFPQPNTASSKFPTEHPTVL